MFPIKTFAPDLPPNTPEIATYVDGVFPSEGGGLAPVPSGVAMSDAFPSACLGCFTFRDLSGGLRTIGGTSTKLYELQIDHSWIDVTNSGGDYLTESRWQFIAWGNWIIATNYSDPIQKQTASGQDFEDLGGTLVGAKYICASNNFVIIAWIYDGAEYNNRVAWSAQGDAEDWTPSSSTQAGYQDLDDTPGGITGITTLGEYLIVFKETAVYMGMYVGPPIIWSFRRIGSFFGALVNDAVVETESGVFYPSSDDFYVFDGNVPRPIGKGIRRWFMENLNRRYTTSMFGVYDGVRRIIFWFFPNNESGGFCNDCLIYDVKTGAWGRTTNISAEAVLVHWQPFVTYDTIDDYFATYDAITTPFTYDDPFWSEVSFSMAFIGTDHILYRLAGSVSNATIKTSFQGNPMAMMEIYNVWPYFGKEPTQCVMYPLTRNTLGASASTGNASTVANGKADMIATGKYIGLEIQLTGDFEIFGVDVDGKQISRN